MATVKMPWDEQYDTPTTEKQSDLMPWEFDYKDAISNKEMSMADVGAGAIENFIPSAIKTAEDIGSAIAHPVDTAAAVANLGVGIFQHLIPERFQFDEQSMQMASNVGQFYADRYGGVENAKKAIAQDPVGVLGDIATVLSGAGAITNGTGLATTAAGMPKTGSTLSNVGSGVMKLGESVEPVSTALKVAGGATKLGGNALAATLSGFTGTGIDAVREAYKAGQKGGKYGGQFLGTMRGEIPVDRIVEEARTALKNIKQQANERYQANAAVFKSDLTELPFGEIYSALDDAKRLGVGKSGIVTNQSVIDTLAKIEAKVDEFRNAGARTAEDFDDLKQAISDIGEAAFKESGTRAKMAATIARKGVTGVLEKHAKNWSTTMKDYSEAKQLTKEIEDALSIGDRKSLDTATRKLTSIMRNNVNTNYGKRQEYVTALGSYGGESIPALAAGAQFSSELPRGIGSSMTAPKVAGAIDPITGVTMAGLSSPRLVGEAVYKAGQLSEATIGQLMAISRNLGIPYDKLISDPKVINALYQAEEIKRQGAK
jgi:hypothetical protein